MADDERDIQRLSPDRLMSGFSTSRVWTALTISLGAHAVIILGTSLGYIYGRIDTEWAEEQKALRQEEAKAEQAAKLKDEIDASKPEGAEPGEPPAGKDGSSKAPPAKKVSDEERLMKERADTPVVKAITEAAKPEDIPKEPGLNISIEDTNPER
ncbi:MAG: hypothetical protein ACYSU0_03725 [Planctomycetota bacterium]|jgi:hypothetical protein